jgi:hypothetical protein
MVGAGATWSIGSVIEAAVSILVLHFVPFVAIAMIAGLPAVLLSLFLSKGFAEMPLMAGGEDLVTVALIVNMVIHLTVMILVIQTLTYGTVQGLRGKKISIGDCLGQGLRNLPIGFAIGFLAYVGIVLGMIALIVPGLILFTMWSVALPAAIVERTGILASLGRSRQLTRGRRWRVFGTALIPLVGTAVINLAIAGIVFGFRGLTAVANQLATEGSYLYQLVYWVLGGIEQAFTVSVFATLYYYLRREKDGVDIEQLAAVFD